jgi:hypothetical protein
VGIVKEVVNEAGVLIGEVLRGARILATYGPEPAFASKAARDLSKPEAFQLLMHHVFHGRIVLAEPVKFDKTGTILTPKPGNQVLVRTSMAGVDFYHASGAYNPKSGTSGAWKDKSFAPTPAFAIVLFRLATFLAKDWGCTQIIWGGIGHGADNKSLNCHQVGTCVDFYGATTSKGKFDVVADWSLAPIYKSDGTAAAKSGQEDRWGSATKTYYRLRASLDSPAYDFYLAVYKFVSEQCTSDGDSSPSVFGQNQPLAAGQTHHPDYPVPARRGGHRDHMHFQLGPAFL